MANNQKKLKAFVRYDGSGRVVASSLILRKNKPRVGRWFEIPTYECCNGDSTTTTTTTQGGSVTPTAWVGYQSPINLWSACNNPATTWTLYTGVDATPLPPGTGLYTDAALTNRVYPNNTMFFAIDGYAYEVINGYTNPLASGMLCQYITTTSTTTTAASQLNISESSSTACSGGGTSVTGYTFTGGTTICNSTMITSNTFAGLNPGTQYISDGINTVEVNVAGFGSPYVYPQGECVTCPLNFTLTTGCDLVDVSPYVRVTSFTGGSTGLVYPGLNLYATEQEALASTQFSTSSKGYGDLYTYNQFGGFPVGATYWAVVQDTGNPANKVAKLITITSCS